MEMCIRDSYSTVSTLYSETTQNEGGGGGEGGEGGVSTGGTTITYGSALSLIHI